MTEPDYTRQQQKRLNYMPWLYFRLRPGLREWARSWQDAWQQEIMALEDVVIEADAFIASNACLFAEPGRRISVGSGSSIAAESVVHGPVQLGSHVSLNHHASLDGGRAGIRIGDNTRIAAYCSLYAFNHGLEADRPIREQAVTSAGIVIGRDVWLGAHVGVVDGVVIGHGAVVGMGSIVTHNVPEGAIVAGNPARIIGWRSNRNNKNGNNQ